MPRALPSLSSFASSASLMPSTAGALAAAFAGAFAFTFSTGAAFLVSGFAGVFAETAGFFLASFFVGIGLAGVTFFVTWEGAGRDDLACAVDLARGFALFVDVFLAGALAAGFLVTGFFAAIFFTGFLTGSFLLTVFFGVDFFVADFAAGFFAFALADFFTGFFVAIVTHPFVQVAPQGLSFCIVFKEIQAFKQVAMGNPTLAVAKANIMINLQ